MKMTSEYKLSISAKRVLMVTSLSAVFGLTSCQQEGPAEKAGKKVDRSIENAEQKVEQATEKTESKLDDVKETITDKTEKVGEYIDDSIITMKIKASMLNDSLLKVSQINVTTVDGVVQLTGTVDSQQSIDRTIEVAQSQEGVKSVQSDLIVAAPSD